MESLTNKFNEITVSVEKRTHDPDSVWERYVRKEGRKCQSISPLPLNTPINDDHIRFVCISDTHNNLQRVTVPNGDVLIHAGDFTFGGRKSEVEQFNQLIGQFPHRFKIVIAGNHELSFRPPKWRVFNNHEAKKGKNQDPRHALTNCIYLEDSEIQIFGYRIYGSPWQPEHMGWAFNIRRGEDLLQKWNLIPEEIDVLITHGPPLGHGDLTRDKEHVGCVELLNSVEKRIKPMYHIFGHIHEGYGCTTNGLTTFINASVCNVSYNAVNLPVIFDLPLKTGQSKI